MAPAGTFRPDTPPRTSPHPGGRKGDRGGGSASGGTDPEGKLKGQSRMLARVLYGGTALFFLLFLLRTFDEKLLPGDEGIAAMGAWRISQGQVPGRDFFESIPPVSMVVNALGFLALGPSVLAERGLALLFGVLLALLVDRLLAAYAADLWCRSFSLAVLTHAGVSLWPIPSHHWAVAILQLGALLALHRGLGSRWGLGWGFAGGALTALGVLTVQAQGAALVALLAMLFFPFIRERTSRWHLLGGWVAGGMSIALLGSALLLPRVSASELWYQWVSFPLSQYHEVSDNRTGLFSGWTEVMGLWKFGLIRPNFLYAASLTLNQLFLWVLPFLTVLVVGRAYWKKYLPRPRLGLLAAGSAAFIAGCLHRWSLLNLAWCSALPLVTLSWAMSRGLAGPRPWVRRGSWLFLILFGASSLTFSLEYYRLAAPEKTGNVTGSAGTLRCRLPREARSFQAAVDAIETHVPQGAPLFCDGYFSLLNFLTLRQNPTRYNQFLYPGMHTPKQAEEVMASLKSRPDAFVLTRRRRPPPSDFDGFLLEHYVPVWAEHGFILLSPRPVEARAP